MVVAFELQLYQIHTSISHFYQTASLQDGDGGRGGGGLATLEAEKLSNLPFALFEHG